MHCVNIMLDEEVLLTTCYEGFSCSGTQQRMCHKLPKWPRTGRVAACSPLRLAMVRYLITQTEMGSLAA